MRKKINFKSTILRKLLPLFVLAAALHVILFSFNKKIRPVVSHTSCPPSHGCFAVSVLDLWGNNSFKYHYASCLNNGSFQGKWKVAADTLILNGEHKGLEFKNTKYLITKDSIQEPLDPNFSKY